MKIYYITETEETTYEIEASSEEDALKKFEDSISLKPCNLERIDFSIKEAEEEIMLTYVAKVNPISVIDDDGKGYKVTDKKLLERVQEILNKSETLIGLEKE
tara:strand:+ start:57 stop:362 length:306 start_codon:yes stop_codon:yes gene_type:complete